MQRSMARNNVKLMPLSTDDKVQLLAELQGVPHFEKTLPASTASGNNSGLTLPSWFVQEHGDKFRRSVLLRTESSGKSSWPVTVSACCFTPTWIQVKFSGGWKKFATSNGLSRGDSLIFALTAMSEFEVHIFRSLPKEGIPSQAQIRESAYDSKRSRKKPKQSFDWRDVQQLVADEEESSEGEVKVNGLDHVAQDNATLQEITRDSLLPGFRKKLRVSNVCRRGGRNETACCLEIPQAFLKTYGSRLHSEVKLQGIREESPVRTMACSTSHGVHMRFYLRGEWRDFVNENHLQAGQELFFTLSANSFFVVREVQQPPS